MCSRTFQVLFNLLDILGKVSNRPMTMDDETNKWFEHHQICLVPCREHLQSASLSALLSSQLSETSCGKLPVETAQTLCHVTLKMRNQIGSFPDTWFFSIMPNVCDITCHNMRNKSALACHPEPRHLPLSYHCPFSHHPAAWIRGRTGRMVSNGKRIHSRWETANVVRIYVDVCARYGHRGFIGTSDFFFRPVFSKMYSCSNNLSIKGLRHRRKLWNHPTSKVDVAIPFWNHLRLWEPRYISIYRPVYTHCINTTPQGKICSCNINSCTVVRHLH